MLRAKKKKTRHLNILICAGVGTSIMLTTQYLFRGVTGSSNPNSNSYRIAKLWIYAPIIGMMSHGPPSAL
jgi:hypothetical protein